MATGKVICGMIIGAMLIGILRSVLYRACFGYRIAQGAKIGFMNVIAVDSTDIGAASVGMFNQFIGSFHLKIGTGVSIRKHNEISCGAWVTEKRFAGEGYARICAIGDGCHITSSHLIDATGGFTLGEHSWVTGSHSQFWTHGIGVTERHIAIGSNCYIGSAARFAPGSSIGKDNIVGLGSVVVVSHNVEGALIAGVPAKVLDANYKWRTRNVSSTETRATNTESASV